MYTIKNIQTNIILNVELIVPVRTLQGCNWKAAKACKKKKEAKIKYCSLNKYVNNIKKEVKLQCYGKFNWGFLSFCGNAVKSLMLI